MNRALRHATAAAVIALSLLSLAAIASGAGEGAVSSNVDVKIWGRAKFDIHYDTDNVRHYLDFASYLVDDGPEEMNINPRDTRLGMSATSQSGDWSFGSTLEIDFYGENSGNNLLPRLRLGFAEARSTHGFSLRAGQDWIPIAQQNPATVDFGVLSWGGNLWWRVPQLTARQKVQNWELLGSIMKHRISTTQEQQERMPWFIARMAYSGLMSGKGLVALGGAYRSVDVGEHHYTPYLVAFECKLPLGQRWMLVGEAWAGEGIGREYVRYGLDYNATHPGGATAIRSQGGFASLTCRATTKTELNIGYGLDDPRDGDLDGVDTAKANSELFVKNQVIFGNARFLITPAYGVGFEVMHFVTDQSPALQLDGQRYTSSVWFTF